jgi:CRISPR-associated endoribonuclease Cas6
MIDEDTLEQLIQNSVVSRYRLKTGVFPVEGRTIPGFIGTISIRFYGTETMMRYIRMLFQFGEYSGIGIKTGIGMGAIQIVEGDNVDR